MTITKTEIPTATLDAACIDFLEKTGNAQSPQNFLNLIGSHLKRLEASPHRMLMYTYNLPDGIGDLRHLIDFSRYYTSITGDLSGLKLQKICFITENKIDLSNFFLTPEIQAGKVYYFYPKREGFDIARAEQSSFILCLCETDIRGPQRIIEADQALRTYLTGFNSYFSVSQSAFIEHFFAPAGYVQSVCEYSSTDQDTVNCQYGKASKYDNAHVMSVLDIGIKFYAEVYQQALYYSGHREARIKAVSFQTEQSKNLFNQDDLENRKIGFGYIQDFRSCLRFLVANLSIGDDKTRNFDVYLNGTYFEDLKKLLSAKIDSPLKIEIMAIFQSANISSIELILSNGEREQIFFTDKKNGKQLHLYDIRGISESIKMRLLSIADVTAGSGDTSYSEALSARNNIPVFSKKEEFFSEMVGHLQILNKRNGDFLGKLGVLIEYFNFFTKQNSGFSLQSFYDFLTMNHKQLLHQLSFYVDYLYKNNNVSVNLNSMFVSSIVTSILSQGTSEEKAMLLRLIPNWVLDSPRSHNNFFVFALKRNIEVLVILYVQDREKFLTCINYNNLLLLLSNPNLREILNNLPLLKQDLWQVVCTKFSQQIDELFSLPAGGFLLLNTFDVYVQEKNISEILSLFLNNSTEEQFVLDEILIRLNADPSLLEEITQSFFNQYSSSSSYTSAISLLQRTLAEENILGLLLRSVPEKKEPFIKLLATLQIHKQTEEQRLIQGTFQRLLKYFEEDQLPEGGLNSRISGFKNEFYLLVTEYISREPGKAHAFLAWLKQPRNILGEIFSKMKSSPGQSASPSFFQKTPAVSALQALENLLVDIAPPTKPGLEA